MSKAASSASPVHQHPAYDDEHGYAEFLSTVQRRVDALLESKVSTLFETDAVGIFDIFLENLPAEHRQHYTCTACRRFFEKYGHLVTLGETGTLTPAVWDKAVPAFFLFAVKAVWRTVNRAKVTGVFYADGPVWGLPQNKDRAQGCTWRHVSATLPVVRGVHAFSPPAHKEPSVASAERLEEYRMLQRGIADFPEPVVKRALGLLESGSLYRSEKCIGVGRWLLNLHQNIAVAPKTRRENVVWAAVAVAPKGYAHVRSGMIGTLLEDVSVDLPVAEIARRFNEKMDPLKYQRPQAPPKLGAVDRAEKLIAELGLAPALRRRFATLDDLQCFWKPAPVAPVAPTGGVFAAVRAKATQAQQPTEQALPGQTMTWVKFVRDVLPKAIALELLAQSYAPMAVMIAAADPTAPPIVQWDLSDDRNTVTWYLWNGGKTLEHWGLSGGFVPIDGICASPAHWRDPEKFRHHSASAFCIVRGAREAAGANGRGLFPEHLRGELHEIRSVIEAHTEVTPLEGDRQSGAVGWMLDAIPGPYRRQPTFRATTDLGVMPVTIDRWE